MPVTLQSRFPEIVVELKPRLNLAMKQTAEQIEAGAKARAPDRPPHGQGLVEAIHTEPVGQTGYRVVAGDDRLSPLMGRSSSARDVFYGHFLEFGTVKAAPRPFLVPAFEESIDDALQRVMAVLKTL